MRAGKGWMHLILGLPAEAVERAFVLHDLDSVF